MRIKNVSNKAGVKTANRISPINAGVSRFFILFIIFSATLTTALTFDPYFQYEIGDTLYSAEAGSDPIIGVDFEGDTLMLTTQVQQWNYTITPNTNNLLSCEIQNYFTPVYMAFSCTPLATNTVTFNFDGLEPNTTALVYIDSVYTTDTPVDETGNVNYVSPSAFSNQKLFEFNTTGTTSTSLVTPTTLPSGGGGGTGTGGGGSLQNVTGLGTYDENFLVANPELFPTKAKEPTLLHYKLNFKNNVTSVYIKIDTPRISEDFTFNGTYIGESEFPLIEYPFDGRTEQAIVELRFYDLFFNEDYSKTFKYELSKPTEKYTSSTLFMILAVIVVFEFFSPYLKKKKYHN